MSTQNFGAKTFEVMNKLVSTVEFLNHMVHEWLGPTTSQIFISNIDNHRLKRNQFYCVVIDKDEVQYSEKDQHNRLSYMFNLQKTTLKKNDMEVHLEELDDLIKKLQMVMTDVKQNKARTYEKA